MKLLHLDTRNNIATVKCWCGAETIIPTTGATEAQPARGRCPRCGTLMEYPNDLKKLWPPVKLIHLDAGTSLAVVECDCGGRALVMTKGATEAKPSTATCPMGHRLFDYPNDVEK